MAEVVVPKDNATGVGQIAVPGGAVADLSSLSSTPEKTAFPNEVEIISEFIAITTWESGKAKVVSSRAY